MRVTLRGGTNGRRELIIATRENLPADWLATGEALGALLTDLLVTGAAPVAAVVRAQEGPLRRTPDEGTSQVVIQRIDPLRGY